MRVRVIDTGSMKLASTPTKKLKDDYRWFAEHLLLIRNALWHHRPLSLHEGRFIKEIDPILDRMFEEDRARCFGHRAEYARSLKGLGHDRQASNGLRGKLNNPFECVAAEHIVSDELLVRVFADSCPWFAEIASPNPVSLTGPAGCGKSMVFRRISLKAMLHKSPDEVSLKPDCWVLRVM